jgi:hypothetical protein
MVSAYNCYTVIVDVCLLVQLFLELGVLFDRPGNRVSGGFGKEFRDDECCDFAELERTGHRQGEERSC